MIVPEQILIKACKDHCPRFEAGDCPFRVSEKDYCPKVKEVLTQLSKNQPQNE